MQRGIGLDRVNRPRRDSLTAREREAIEHIVAGMLGSQLAAVHGCKQKTILIEDPRGTEEFQIRTLARLGQFAEYARTFR